MKIRLNYDIILRGVSYEKEREKRKKEINKKTVNNFNNCDYYFRNYLLFSSDRDNEIYY